MANVKTCDRCKKPVERIVLKLYISPAINGKNDHSNYTGHADIGDCCKAEVMRFVKFQGRKKRGRPTPDSMEPRTAGQEGAQERAGRGQEAFRSQAAG